MRRYEILLFFIFTIFFHMASQAYAYSRGKHINSMELPDFFQDRLNLTYQNHTVLINDTIPIGLTLYLLYKLIYYKKWIEYYRYIFMLSIMYFMRAILFSATVLPDSSKRCNPDNLLGGCNDLIFSGHTGLTVITLMFLYYNFYKSNTFIAISILTIFILSFVILVKRAHYTVDILLALIIPYLLVKQYRNTKIVI